jgi:altronate dehydratase small subunit
MDMVYKTVMMKPQDKVATALIDIPAGVELTVTCQHLAFVVVLADPIDFGTGL